VGYEPACAPAHRPGLRTAYGRSTAVAGSGERAGSGKQLLYATARGEHVGENAIFARAIDRRAIAGALDNHTEQRAILAGAGRSPRRILAGDTRPGNGEQRRLRFAAGRLISPDFQRW